MTEKGQRWVYRDEAEAQGAGGFVRRVLAYDEELMCVENAFEAGCAAPLHHHPHLQIAYVVDGVFDVCVDGEIRRLSKGDSVLLPDDIPHSVTCVEKGIVLDIFTPMRKDFV